MLMLYHLSENPNLRVLTPRIPKSAATSEDKETKRVCFASSINGCLNAIGCGGASEIHPMLEYNILKPFTSMTGNERWTDMAKHARKEFVLSRKDIEMMNMAHYIEYGVQLYPFYYVYIPSRHVPCEPATSVYDYTITGEVWVKEEIEVTMIGGVYVINSTNLGKKTKVQGATVQAYSYHYITTPPEYRCPFDVLKIDDHKSIHDDLDELVQYNKTCKKLCEGMNIIPDARK